MSEKYSIFDSLKKGFNIFMNKDPTSNNSNNIDLYNFLSTYGGSDRPDRLQLSYGNDKTIITPMLNRIAIDCSNINIKHVIVDPKTNRYKEEVKDSGLNRCLNLEANLDQTGRKFIHDLILQMLDEGVVAVVPTDVELKSKGESYYNGTFSSFDIKKLRVGKIVKWYPDYVDVQLYNEKTMIKQVISVSKYKCAIIENPFYHVMNANQSILRRLNRKLAILDLINEKQGSDKLEMILRLPYAVRSELKQELAKRRTKDIEEQLATNKRGIVYLDNQEQLQQLNKPIENQIMSVVEYLTSMLYGQFGISKEVFEGTANELQINYYHSNTIKPILNTIVDEFKRKFLTKTARSEGHTIRYYINTFEYASINNLADSADKFTRNAIMTSNEFRDILGLVPSEQQIADELSNKNMPMEYQNMLPYYDDQQYDDQ